MELGKEVNMKVNLKKDALQKALMKVSNIIPNRTTLPVLANVLLEAENGKLTLTTTDLELRDVLLEMADRPTAIVSTEDIMACGIVQALHQAGWVLPRDLSVIGFDDSTPAKLITPALTTVHIPKEEMGRAAVNVLLDRIRGGHREHLRVEFPCRLVVRASCFSQP